ncbi:MAG: M14-type cytosolic carboxypeptidase [Verrucomicrobiota bacterium]
MKRIYVNVTAILVLLELTALAAAQEKPAITFNKNFEGGSLGKIEKLSDAHFRCYVEGQCDEHGRNRQANWYYFRMDGVQEREVTLTLTDFVGEYNDKPGACPMNADTIPVFSYDDEHWQHFPAMGWDDQKKEATLRFSPEHERIWIAHIPPYTHSRLLRLLEQLDRAEPVRVEVIGKSVQGRDLHLVTVTNFEKPDDGKRTVWLQARQHAWESGTSYVMEGALRFIASDDPRARELRDRIVFKFTPMMDPDGCAGGKVRFNANGYDVNRHWDEVDLRRKEFLERMPETWYVKKAILGYVESGRKINLMLNLHNDELPEYLDTQSDDEPTQQLMQRFYDALVAKTTFDPNQKFRVSDKPGNTTNFLWKERKVPVLVMEQRIGTSMKLGRRPTVEDRLAFGKQLITAMAETVLQ